MSAADALHLLPALRRHLCALLPAADALHLLSAVRRHMRALLPAADALHLRSRRLSVRLPIANLLRSAVSNPR